VERIINFEGKRHVFPADATDEEIESVLAVPTGGLKPNGKINYGTMGAAEELDLLKTQLADLQPDEHGAGRTAELQLRDRIARLEKQVQSRCSSARRNSAPTKKHSNALARFT
jgi:hypothetical protein